MTMPTIPRINPFLALAVIDILPPRESNANRIANPPKGMARYRQLHIMTLLVPKTIAAVSMAFPRRYIWYWYGGIP